MGSETRMIQELTAIADSLGMWHDEENVYKINEDTCECLKELLRLLRRDGSSFLVLRHLGSINIVEKDLIPMIKGYCLTDEGLADYSIRLLVSLTYPALVFFKEKVPKDVDQKRIFLEINGYLRNYKILFSQQKEFWEVLCKKALSISTKDPIDQSEEEKILLERILIMIRNILAVPKDTYLDIADEDEMITEDLISSLKASGTLDLILQYTADVVSHQFCFHLLEIIHSLLRGQCPEFLAYDSSISCQQLSKRSKPSCIGTESMELEELKAREKRLHNFVGKSSRFNRFKDSTYVVKNVKSIGEHDLIYHKTTEDPRKISLDQDKTADKRPKNRAIMTDNFSTRTSKMGETFRRPSSKVHKILKEFCETFLKDSYAPLMAFVKSALENRNAQDNDETYYFFTAYFFMDFNRVAEGDPSVIEETFNFEYFHYLHSKVMDYAELIPTARSDREAVQAISRRCHTCLKAYKALLFTIASMKNVQNEQMLGHVKEIMNKLFNEPDYRELLQILLRNYDEQKMSPQFLRDLIETNHMFLKMFEHFTDKSLHLELFCRYNNAKVIRSYLLALEHFEVNPESLNHAIIRMFHRIACECKSPVYFFQLSIFRVFQRCFELNKIEKNNKLGEIVNFARYIVREFTKLAKDNKKLLIECLFWKSKGEMRLIDENYAEIAPKKKPRKKRARKNGTGFVADDLHLSEDELENLQNDLPREENEQVASISEDSGEGFVPLFSSTQTVPSEKPKELPSMEELSTIREVSGKMNETIGGDGAELPCESELLNAFGADNDVDLDDDLLDMDDVINQVADDSNDSSLINGLNETIIENTVINNSEALSDTESVGEVEVTASKRKKQIILDDSDDE